MTKQVFKTVFAGRELVVETGQVAKQANGSAVVRYGESTVLTAATMSKKMATGDFFPLQVNYEEKMYAAGKYPGGFNKREGRPSTVPISTWLPSTSRSIDLPISWRNPARRAKLAFSPSSPAMIPESLATSIECRRTF